ncbi:UDP-glucuronosyltransferase 2C1-like [Nasonia vitripennis]|uniref:UDP-glucuronosyltransferase n=1 Tax=Nasonia vitripennis TaxID=7425 RepID=A0A7M7H7Z6_NASVI|nr:UDP-glucuronosyltransferase 2C1-like [Nasonia vitripennis]
MVISNMYSVLLLLSVLCLIAQTSESLRILGIFPMNVKSHFATCGELMRGLAEKGHRVDVYSHFPLKNPKPPNYTDYSLDGTLAPVTNNLTYDVTSLTTATDAIVTWLELGGRPACQLIGLPIFQKLLHEPPKDPAYDLVIVEVSLANCHIAWGRRLNIPVIGVVAPLLPDWLHNHLGNPINLAVESSSFAPFAAPASFYERLKNFYIFHHLRLSFNYYVRRQDEYVAKFFGTDYPNSVELQKDLSLVLVNHHSALSGLRTFAPPVVPIGGLHIVDRNESLPQELQEWLDESKHGFVYFSFGSMIRIETFPDHMLDAFYKTFKNIAPVRVLLKIARPEELPAGMPSNVLTQSWIPQIQVLKHKRIKAFVTHGGLMGTQEAARYGVPMVGVPLISDEFFNVENCVRKRIAVKVDLKQVTEKTLTRALRQVLDDPFYKRNAEQISKDFTDVPMTPMNTALFWIEYIARHGKNALRSPIVDMPWWQSSLFDVYTFICAVFVLTTCIVKIVYKKVVRTMKLKND